MGNRISGRLASNSNRQNRTSPADAIYSYSLNKSYFSNFFIMGGERFEASNPDYLFGENCDLNYLSCANPLSFPYKQSQNYFIPASGKRSNGRTNIRSNPSRSKSGNNLKSRNSKIPAQKNLQPSQPLKCLINLRKETLRLVKVTQLQSIDTKSSDCHLKSCEGLEDENINTNALYNGRVLSESNDSSHDDDRDENYHTPTMPASSSSDGIQTTIDLTTSTCETVRGSCYNHSQDDYGQKRIYNNDHSSSKQYSKLSIQDCSQLDGPSADRSCYSNVKNRDRRLKANGSMMYQNYQPVINLERSSGDAFNKENLNISTNGDTSRSIPSNLNYDGDKERSQYLLRESTSAHEVVDVSNIDDSLMVSANNHSKRKTWRSPVYNIEFNFDVEVDCSVRIYYFCRREIASNGIVYKPLHASYKSKVYHYKSGFNHKFQQTDHTFQPDLFDEESLCYRPFDQAGNFDPAALFPVVIHCVAQEGPYPRQSHSLVAIVEKNQNDGSYSIKPLKQLLFIDGLQYLLQEIYGIENKHLASRKESASSMHKTNSIKSTHSNMGSTSSIDRQTSLTNGKSQSNHIDNLFECVICMSEERDTLLLPCRHLCLCKSCAHHLRYQANNCPICRAPFRALIHIRAVHKSKYAKDQDKAASGDAKVMKTSSTTTDSSSKIKEKKIQVSQQQQQQNPSAPLISRESVVNFTGPSSSVTTLSKRSNTTRTSLTSAPLQRHNHTSGEPYLPGLELTTLDAHCGQYNGTDANSFKLSSETPSAAMTTSAVLPNGYEYTSLFIESMKNYNMPSSDDATE